MSAPDRLAIARALREIGMLLEIKGANRFKARAYEKGARALEALEGDFDQLVREERLTEVPGIGRALAEKITELRLTGRCEMLERLRRELPPGILELSRVPHLSPERIASLHEALGIRGVADLAAACEEGRVRAVKGFGEKTERRILEGLRRLESQGDRVLLHEALREGERLLEYLRASPTVERADIAGSLRRYAETVGNLDLVAAARDRLAARDDFLGYPPVVRVIEAADDGPSSMRLAGGLLARLTIVPPADYVTALFALTGSKAHLEKLEARARDKRTVTGAGALRGKRRITVKTEADIYRRLDLPYIPPELREDEGEIEAAGAGTLPTDLVTLEDIQGLVHCHTDFSDGKDTVEGMARGAEALGMKYITITDHSQSAFYAGGLKEDRLRRLWDEIDKAQQKVKVRLLRGTESDILQDGSLDYPDEILKRLDVVIASIHNRFRMDADQMTRRLVRAMRHPLFKVWGHALGRYIQRRPPFACHVEDVLDAIAESRAAVEINGDPHRLDMEPRWVRAARRRGINFVISTDAHSVAGLRNVRYGVAMARRGWVRRGEVLNALPEAQFRKEVKP